MRYLCDAALLGDRVADSVLIDIAESGTIISVAP